MQIFGLSTYPDEAMLDYALELARGPRVLYVPTAAMEDPSSTLEWYERLRGRAETTHLHFFPYPPHDMRELALKHREAWEDGVLLSGWSAGAICWFEAAVTDSFGPQLEGMRNGLGFLPGSACPHYDGEELRRPRYADLVRNGFPPVSPWTTTLPPGSRERSSSRS
jgi:dipeptidase E